MILMCLKTYAQKPVFENRTQNWLQNSGHDFIAIIIFIITIIIIIITTSSSTTTTTIIISADDDNNNKHFVTYCCSVCTTLDCNCHIAV